MPKARSAALVGASVIAGIVVVLPVNGAQGARSARPWFGGAEYQVSGPVTSVSATVTIPRLRCPSRGTFATWPTVWGHGSDSQVGLTCANGVAETTATAGTYHLRVSPGDAVVLSIGAAGSRIFDSTTGKSASTAPVFPRSTDAEPKGGGVGTVVTSPVAAVGSIHFTNVTVNGIPLRSLDPNRTAVLSRRHRTLVTMSPIVDGTDFTTRLVAGIPSSVATFTITGSLVKPPTVTRTQSGYLINAFDMWLTLPSTVSNPTQPNPWDCSSRSAEPDCQGHTRSKGNYYILDEWQTDATPGPKDEAVLVKALEHRGWTINRASTGTLLDVNGHGFAGTVQISFLSPHRDVKPFPYAAPELEAYFTLRQVSPHFG